MELVYYEESKLFNNDTDFETEEDKEEYYGGEFWQGCDHLTIPGRSPHMEEEKILFCIMWDDEEVLIQTFEYDEEIEKILLRFASDEHEKYFDELHTGNDFRVKEDPLYDQTKPYIEYRGGKGYYYYHHQYKFNIC